MKKLIWEIIGIILLSSLMGLAFNWAKKSPTPLIYQNKGNKEAPNSGQTKVLSEFYQALDGKKFKNASSIEELKKNIVTFDQLKDKLNDPNLYIIDARAPEIFAKGHIGSAVNIYPYLEDHDKLMDLLMAVPDDKTIVIYCDGGECDLSHEIAKRLIDEFMKDNVFLYPMGWEEWSQKGLSLK